MYRMKKYPLVANPGWNAIPSNPRSPAVPLFRLWLETCGVRSMNVLQAGVADKLVMTVMRPFLLRTKRRLVSPGGDVMQIGLVRTRPGKAFDDVYPYVGALAGM